MSTIRFEVDERGVARLTLNRPDVRNAFNGQMLEEFAGRIRDLPPAARVVVIAAEGKAFSAGADLGWMGSASAEGSDSALLLNAFSSLDQCRVPVVGRVQGAAMAGAGGLVACCDVAVAGESAFFGFSEVRLGLVPAVVSPYVIRKTGYAFARAAFVSGERFSAQRAYEVGLVHKVVPDDELDSAVAEVVEQILMGAPDAQLEARKLVAHVFGKQPDEVADQNVELITRMRSGEEAREGISAFLEKRPPNWGS